MTLPEWQNIPQGSRVFHVPTSRVIFGIRCGHGKKGLTPEENLELAGKMLLSGATVRQIAKACHMSHMTVHRLRKVLVAVHPEAFARDYLRRARGSRGRFIACAG